MEQLYSHPLSADVLETRMEKYADSIMEAQLKNLEEHMNSELLQLTMAYLEIRYGAEHASLFKNIIRSAWLRSANCMAQNMTEARDATFNSPK